MVSIVLLYRRILYLPSSASYYRIASWGAIFESIIPICPHGFLSVLNFSSAHFQNVLNLLSLANCSPLWSHGSSIRHHVGLELSFYYNLNKYSLPLSSPPFCHPVPLPLPSSLPPSFWQAHVHISKAFHPLCSKALDPGEVSAHYSLYFINESAAFEVSTGNREAVVSSSVI